MSYRTFRSYLQGNTRVIHAGYGSVRTLQNTTLDICTRHHFMLYTRGDLPEIHRTNVAVLTDNDPGAPQKLVVVCRSRAPHLMGHGPGRPIKTRGRSNDGRRNNSSSSTLHLIGRGPGRPVEKHWPPHGSGGAADIEPTSHGPRPGPAHQISRGWATARRGQ